MILQVILEILFLFILPVILLYLYAIPIRYRMQIMASIVLIVAGIVMLENQTAHELGFRLDNIGQSAIAYGIFTLLAVPIIILYAKSTGKKRIARWYKDGHFLFWFIPVSFAQQFIFMSFLLERLHSVTYPVLGILITGLLFASMHLIYKDAAMDIPLAFVAGVCFAALFTFFPNIIVGTISHMILNFTAVLYSFFLLHPHQE